MKKIGIVFFVIAFLASCENINTFDKEIDNFQIADGCYEGYFEYQDASYWCSICLENGKYIEWPSGGVMFQKTWSCLTVGTYSTESNTLSFVLDSYKFKDFPEPCTTNMLLPGKYEITNANKIDSLIFKKGTGENQITYFLKKHETVEK
ncbi:MAG: hypothetical protein Q8T08_08780 [Ignavibacteria bacterium]|nr:hypothetical protein [Ignavibacteria bacterium]